MAVTLGRELVQASLQVESDEVAEGLSISLTQPPASVTRWRFRVRVRTDEGLQTLGGFDTCPPHGGSPYTRIVGVAFCPGAREWTVDVKPAPLSSDESWVADNSSVALSQGSRCASTPAGVYRVGERALLRAGVAGAVVVHAGETVRFWRAWSAAAGADVQIADATTTTTITIPQNGFAVGGEFGLLKGPLAMAFNVTGGFLVEIAESA